MWHEPALFHDHGADPSAAHPALVEAMEAHWNYEIGSEWLSSPHENEFPHGMHAAFTNLSETDTGCPQFNGEPGDLCIDAYFYQVHAAGTVAHGRVDVHSYKIAMLVCDQSGANCGYVLTGGVHDYIWSHAPYKDYFCENSDGNPDPVIPEQYQFQTPYVGLSTDDPRDKPTMLWNSLGPNAVTQAEVLTQRGYIPNRLLRSAWIEYDVWDRVRAYSPECANAAADTPWPGFAEDNGMEFRVFTLTMTLPEERPFVGWTNRHGVIVEGCTTEGLDCVPLVISEGVPQGRAFLNRKVNAEYAPLQDFYDGTAQLPPPFDLP
jgi:hypothetical protein